MVGCLFKATEAFSFYDGSTFFVILKNECLILSKIWADDKFCYFIFYNITNNKKYKNIRTRQSFRLIKQITF